MNETKKDTLEIQFVRDGEACTDFVEVPVGLSPGEKEIYRHIYFERFSDGSKESPLSYCFTDGAGNELKCTEAGEVTFNGQPVSGAAMADAFKFIQKVVVGMLRVARKE
jgi:hypothetical protein